MRNKYSILFLGEIHFSFITLFWLIKYGIVPKTVIIQNTNFDEFNLNLTIKEKWYLDYLEYHYNWKYKIEHLCNKYNINFIKTDDYNLKLSKHKYLIIAGFSNILRKSQIKLFDFALNIHPSILPYYRGPQPEANMIINNEDYFGITIHSLTNKIDSGDIFFQKKIDKKNYNIYELEQIESKIAVQGIKKIIENDIKKINQNDISKGNYFTYINKDKLNLINYNATDVYRLLKLQPEEFPFYMDNKKILYPIEIGNNGLKINLNNDKIYFTKWLEKTSAHNIVYKQWRAKYCK